MTSNKCQRCGLINFAGTAECRRCNAPIAWGAEGAASQPAFSSQPALSAGDSDSYRQQQPLQAAPSRPHYPLPAGGYVSPYAHLPKLRSGLATVSLTLGILGIFTAGLLLIGSLVGLLLGIRAVLRANREPNVYGGKGVAIGGIVTNSLGMVSIIPWALVAAIAIPNLLASRMAANELSAIATVRSLSTTEATYQSTVGRGRSFGTAQDLVESGLLKKSWATNNGYQFKIRLFDPNGYAVLSGARDAVRFEIVATPIIYGSTGRLSLYVSENYVIRCADRQGKEATSTDLDLDQYGEQAYPTRDYGNAPRRRN